MSANCQISNDLGPETIFRAILILGRKLIKWIEVGFQADGVVIQAPQKWELFDGTLRSDGL